MLTTTKDTGEFVLGVHLLAFPVFIFFMLLAIFFNNQPNASGLECRATGHYSCE